MPVYISFKKLRGRCTYTVAVEGRVIYSRQCETREERDHAVQEIAELLREM